MKEVGPDQGQVLDPDQHMEMQRTPRLELEAIKVGNDVSLHGLLGVPKYVVTPPVGVCPGEIPTGDLLKDVRHVQGLEHWEVRGFLAVLLAYLLDEARPGKGQLVRADSYEEGGKPILADGVYQ